MDKINTNKTPDINNVIPTNSASNPTDADNQAFLDLGQLLYLANTYLDLMSKGETAEAAKVLQEFQATYALFHFSTDANGNVTVTFDYDEGAQKGVPITYGPFLEIFQQLPKLSNPPTGADLTTWQNAFYSTTPITWPDGQKQTLLERMLLALFDSHFSLANNLANPITNTSFLLFYLSLVNSPGNIAAGTLDDILSEGYYDGSMFNAGNIRAIAMALRDHLANDSTILSSDVVLAGLQITTKDQLYPQLASWFENTTPDGSRESEDWMWEAEFFPISNAGTSQKTINALPDRENSNLANQLALEKKAMSKKEPANATLHRIASE